MSSQSVNLREEDSFFSRKYIDFREKKLLEIFSVQTNRMVGFVVCLQIREKLMEEGGMRDVRRAY